MEFYEWKGEPIIDLEKFCKDHNTKMVNMRKYRQATILGEGRVDLYEGTIEMPELFADCLRLTSTDCYRYERIKEE